MKFCGYYEDGANWQAQSVLAYLKSHGNENINVVRYCNCREQGYIVFCRKNVGKKIIQLNVAFYEHRNSDRMCVVVFDKVTLNDPINSDVWEFMEDKYDYTESFGFGEIVECGNYIVELIKDFFC